MDKKRKSGKGLKILMGTVLSLAAAAVVLVAAYNIYIYLLTGIPGRLEPDITGGGDVTGETMEPGYTGEIIDDPVIINDQAQSVQEIAVLGDTDNITNILLLGIDTGGKDGYAGLSDAIIIVTINRNPGRESIKLTSILRDTCVPVEGYGPRKINAAYSYGGYSLLLDTIEKQLRLKITRVAAVNFQVYEKAVNRMGGIDIELTAEEARHLNEGQSGGSYHLDGEAALSYARIRSIGNDWGRTGRHRAVLSAMMTRARSMNLLELNSLLLGTLPQVHTNIPRSELTEYINSSAALLSYPVKQTFFPEIGSFTDPYISGVGRALVMKKPAETVRGIQHFIYD